MGRTTAWRAAGLTFRTRSLLGSLFRHGRVQLFVLAVVFGCSSAPPQATGGRSHPVEQEEIFRITPLSPPEVLRKNALSARPPRQKGTFRKPDLVRLGSLDPTIQLDIRYATTRNFMGVPFYTRPEALLQRPAAEALRAAHHDLRRLGVGLLIFDAYRPWFVTKMFWDATPPAQRDFVADPAQGSRHNRGAAVDLTLYNLKSGAPLPMPSGYDEFSERAHIDYQGGSEAERSNRQLLREAMEAHGFEVYPVEWWHYDFNQWELYPVLNLTFEEIP